jgi:mono/diheme cytochrome c family protein
MKPERPSLFLALAAFIGMTNGSMGGQETRPAAAGVYTAAQAQAGQAAYTQNCAGCHLANFRGSGDAPAVAGPDFTAKWGPRAVNELFTYLVQSMPPTNPGALGEAGTLEVTAYLLQINGAPAGQQPLTATLSAPMSALLTGQPRAQAPASTAAGSARGRSGMPLVLGAGTGAGRGASSNRGVTVRGEVRNYVPVTAEMLKSPPRGDWLIFRGN